MAARTTSLGLPYFIASYYGPNITYAGASDILLLVVKLIMYCIIKNQITII